MNRRESLKSLFGGAALLPRVQSIERLDPKPGEVLVLTVPHEIDLETEAVIRRELERAFGTGVKALVLAGGMTLRVAPAIVTTGRA